MVSYIHGKLFKVFTAFPFPFNSQLFSFLQMIILEKTRLGFLGNNLVQNLFFSVCHSSARKDHDVKEMLKWKLELEREEKLETVFYHRICQNLIVLNKCRNAWNWEWDFIVHWRCYFHQCVSQSDYSSGNSLFPFLKTLMFSSSISLF